ncbi:hypothetical protein ACU1JV_26715 [Paenibacillus sp. T2-29]
MRLYRAYNQYTGDAPIHVIVIADSDEEASSLAAKQFKADERSKRHDASWWNNIQVELLHESCEDSFVSELSE